MYSTNNWLSFVYISHFISTTTVFPKIDAHQKNSSITSTKQYYASTCNVQNSLFSNARYRAPGLVKPRALSARSQIELNNMLSISQQFFSIPAAEFYIFIVQWIGAVVCVPCVTVLFNGKWYCPPQSYAFPKHVFVCICNLNVIHKMLHAVVLCPYIGCFCGRTRGKRIRSTSEPHKQQKSKHEANNKTQAKII